MSGDGKQLTKQNSTKDERRKSEIKGTERKLSGTRKARREKGNIARASQKTMAQAKANGRQLAREANIRMAGRDSERLHREIAARLPITSQMSKVVRSRLLPSMHAPVQYPDKYNGISSICRTKQIIPVVYGAQDFTPDSITWPAGKFHFNVLPDFLYPVSFLAAEAGGQETWYFDLFQATKEAWLDPVVSTQSAFSPPDPPRSKELILSIGQTYNVITPLTNETRAFTANGYLSSPVQWPCTTISGGLISGWGMKVPANSCKINYTVLTTGANQTLTFQFISSSGVLATFTTAALASGQNSATVNIAGAINEGVGPVGFRILANQGTGSSESIVLSRLSVRFVQDAVPVLRWCTVPQKDDIVIRTLYQQYRVTAQSCLMQFTGAPLTNAGTFGAYAYRGGYSPGLMNFQEYSTVSSINEAFVSPVKTGLYYWWTPADTNAMEFRHLKDPVVFFPYLTVVGSNSDTNAGAGGVPLDNLVLHVFTCYEDFTTAQVVPSFPMPIGTDDALAEIAKQLADFPQLMENPIHLGAIASKLGSFLKGTFNAGQKAYQFYKDNKQYIDPLAAALHGAVLAAV